MDTSETYRESIVSPLEPLENIERVKWYEDPVYIKMCDCEEIQSKWRPQIKEPDFYWLNGKVWSINFQSKLKRLSPKAIWLPRQDQLQEMVRGDGDIVLDFLQGFMEWASQTPHSLNSMEQLWLAFYMSELHQKTWNGEEWVK